MLAWRFIGTRSIAARPAGAQSLRSPNPGLTDLPLRERAFLRARGAWLHARRGMAA